MSGLKVLVLDIETAPMLAYVWALKDITLSIGNLKKDWYVMAWAAKWLNDPVSKVIYRDQRNEKDMENDKRILTDLWKLLDEADIIITQNGKNFDARKLNARFITHGMNPPSKYRHYDTYQVISKVAAFTSNKLEYLTDKLCVKYKKLSHKKYPGLTLWKECLARNRDAWNEMKKYNIHDVLSTEELYLKVRAWSPESAPKPFEITDADKQCGTCGHIGQMREGKPRRAKKRIYRQHSCLKCGAWQAGETILGAKRGRKRD